MSAIEWTEKTWNPTIGCTEVSPGCEKCYAARMAFRLSHIPAMAEDYAGLTKKLPNGKIVWTGEVKELPDRLNEFSNIKKPTIIFVDSMSDLFHKDVSWNFLYKVFERMLLTHQHIYQVLTKRAERLHLLNDVYLHLKRNYPDAQIPLKNVWIGVSVENQKAAEERIPKLIEIDAEVKFLSCEPLLGPVEIPIDWSDGSGFIDWIIVGGESGPKARPMNPAWVYSLRDQCKSSRTSFFFKQWGAWKFSGMNSKKSNIGPWKGEKVETVGMDAGESDGVYVMTNVGKKNSGRLLDGRTYDEYPSIFYKWKQ